MRIDLLRWRDGACEKAPAHSRREKRGVAPACWIATHGILAALAPTLAIPALAWVTAGVVVAEEAAQASTRGVVRARNQAGISSDLAVPVAFVSVRDGDRFTKDQVLVRFDCRRFEAEHAVARAELKEMDVALRSAVYLRQRNAGGKLDEETAETRVAKAAARAKVLATRLADCEIRAPYAGRVGEVAVRQHETPVAGRPLLQLLESGELEVEMVAPAVWLRWITLHKKFVFNVDETGTRERATVERIGAFVDPVSQTIKITGRIAEASPGLLAGMSGTATFARGGD